MSANYRKPPVGGDSSNRRRMLPTNVQPRSTSSRSSKEQARDVVQPDWERAFKILSAQLSKSWVSSDCLILLAYELKDKVGDEAARVFVEHLSLNREKETQEFMG